MKGTDTPFHASAPATLACSFTCVSVKETAMSALPGRGLTAEKYTFMKQEVAGFSMKTKRHIFKVMRENADIVTTDAVLPSCGLTAGEFAMMYELESYKSGGS